MTLDEIEQMTNNYANAYSIVTDRVTMLEDQIERIKRQHLPSIKEAVKEAVHERGILFNAIESAPELFDKPKTYTFSGIRVGLYKERIKGSSLVFCLSHISQELTCPDCTPVTSWRKPE